MCIYIQIRYICIYIYIQIRYIYIILDIYIYIIYIYTVYTHIFGFAFQYLDQTRLTFETLFCGYGARINPKEMGESIGTPDTPFLTLKNHHFRDVCQLQTVDMPLYI